MIRLLTIGNWLVMISKRTAMYEKRTALFSKMMTIYISKVEDQNCEEDSDDLQDW